MNKLHICFVERGYPHSHGGGGGAGTRIQLIAHELVRRGHSVSVITASCEQCPSLSDDEGVSVYRHPQSAPLHWYCSKLPGLDNFALSLRYLERGWQIKRTLDWLHNENPIDLVEFTEGGDFWHAWKAPFARISYLSGSRYTFLKESRRPVARRDWWQRRLELMFISRVEQVISPSATMLKLVERELNKSLSNAVILSNPVDPRLLELPLDNPASSNEDSLIIMFAARNEWVKGGDVLLRAARTVHQAFPRAQFIFFGYHQSANGKPDYVTFHPFIPKEDLFKHYQRATICVIPSRWDNSPNTVYEAMAAGKPVVATNVGGIPEIVVNRKTGLLVEPGNSEQLAQALIQLLSKKELREKMGRKGQRRVQRTFNLVDHVETRLRLYQRLHLSLPSRHSSISRTIQL